MFDAKSIVQVLKEEGILYGNHTILPKYYDVHIIRLVTDEGKEYCFSLPYRYLIEANGAVTAIENTIIFDHIGSDSECKTINSIRNIIIILDYKVYHKYFKTSKGMYDKMIYIEKGVKYGPYLYREDFKYKETSIRKI